MQYMMEMEKYIYTEDEIVFNKTSSNMFSKFQSVEAIDFGEYIDTSNVTDIRGMFTGCSSLISLDASKWDTSKVTDMTNMFQGCSSLTEIKIGCKWQTATANGNMFTGSGFTQEQFNTLLEQTKQSCLTN